MVTEEQLRNLVDEVLNLQGRSARFKPDTPLMGAVPELDSMGVVTLLNAFEERLGVHVEDDEIDASIFETWMSLVSFVQGRVV